MDELKKLLGDDLFSQMTAKLGDKELYLHNKGEKVIVDDGTLIKKDGMIPKSRFDEINIQRKENEDKVKDLMAKLEAAEKLSSDAEKYKTEKERIFQEYNSFKSESEKKAKDLEVFFKVKDALRDEGANPQYIDKLSTDFKIEEVVIGSDGKIKEIKKEGKDLPFDEFMKDYKIKNSVLFGDTKRQGFDPKKGTNPPADVYTEDEVKKMSASEVAANVEKVNKSVEFWNSQK